MKSRIISVLLFVTLLLVPDTLSQWKTLEPGIALGTFHSPLYPESTDAQICVVKIDPHQHELHLFNASHPKQGKNLSAKEWARKEGLKVAINAAMYQEDYKSSVSLMRTHGHVNNPRISKDKTVLAFHPRKKKLPPVRIVDMQCDDFENFRADYGSMVQSIRMLSCRGKNVWQESQKRWSIASVGIDSSENVLFMHVTTPHSVHEFINVLKKLPLSLKRAMYMEGGSPAQLFMQTDSDTLEFLGNYSSGGRPTSAPSLPNVLGVR
ncbi:MAG: phosphodiester glycosidase family protein [Chitinispirillaceae bacterium]